MAKKWCLEHGVLDPDAVSIIFQNIINRHKLYSMNSKEKRKRRNEEYLNRKMGVD